MPFERSRPSGPRSGYRHPLRDACRDLKDWLDMDEGEGRAAADPDEADWKSWLRALWPHTFSQQVPFASFHEEFWDWAWAIQPGIRPKPFVAVWARGAGKSTNAEPLPIALHAREVRSYCLYVSRTQDQADEHVDNIGLLLEGSDALDRHYPGLAARQVSKYGHSKGWRRSRLWTESGLIIDALGLDKSVRGLKKESRRPDLIIFDDIDETHDTDSTTLKIIDKITRKIIPAGSRDCAVVFVQNKVADDSVCARLCDGRADFLSDRIVSGPHPAVRGLEIGSDEEGRPVIVAGEPTWEGMSLADCNGIMRDIGPRAFRIECQHEPQDAEGALCQPGWFSEHRFDGARRDALPVMDLIAVAVDPPGGATECGIVVVGIHGDKSYTLADRSGKMGAEQWPGEAVRAYDDFKADVVVAEINFGGDMVANAIATVPRDAERGDYRPRKDVPVRVVRVSRGKRPRAEPVASLIHSGGHVHVGVLPELQREWTSWVPGDPSPNRLDAEVWGVAYVQRLDTGGKFSAFKSTVW